MSYGSAGSTGSSRNNNNNNNNSNAAAALLALREGPPRPREMQPPSKSRFRFAFFMMMVGLMMIVIGAISVPAAKPLLAGTSQSTKSLQVANASLTNNLARGGLNGTSSPLVAANAVNARLPVVTPAQFGTRVNAPNLLDPSNRSNALVAARGGNGFNWSPNLVTAIVEQRTTPEFTQMMRRERAVMIQYCEVDPDCMKFYSDKLEKVAAAASAGANLNIKMMENSQSRQRREQNLRRRNMQMVGESAVAPYLEPIVGALRASARGTGEILGEVPAGASWAFVTSIINTSVEYVTKQGMITQGIILIIAMVTTNFAIGNMTAFLNAIAILGRMSSMSARSAAAVARFMTAAVSGPLMKAQTARQGRNTNARQSSDLAVEAAAAEVIAAAAAETTRR